jgi:1,4-alpha-glucan branching enzyme
LVKDLNHLYREEPALHGQGYNSKGFEWIDCHDSTQSVISFLRKDSNEVHQNCVIIANFTPMPRHHYRIGLPTGGCWQEKFNSDSMYYGGSNQGNPLPIQASEQPWMGHNHSIELTLPPLGLIILQVMPS